MRVSILVVAEADGDFTVQTARAVGKLRSTVEDSGSAELSVQAVGDCGPAELLEPGAVVAVITDHGIQCRIMKMCAASGENVSKYVLSIHNDGK